MRRISIYTLLALAACGNTEPSAPNDASTDQATQSDTSAPVDAGAEAEAAAPNDDAPFAAQRATCTFKQGALPSETFGPSIANFAYPIDTVVIVSQENRSFDEYFAHLANVDAPAPNTSLLDSDGGAHAPFHQTDYCFADTGHDWDSMHKDWNGGKNDGFVKVNDPNGVRTLGWFDQTDIPFYYDIAGSYGVADAYFSGLLGPTGPNRLYLYSATSYGHVKNGPGVPSSQPSIFQRMHGSKVPFKVYSAATGTNPTCPGPYAFETAMFCGDIPEGSVAISQFMTDAAAGKLPAVSWIYPGSDEHPSADMQVGESKVQTVFDALAASPQWSHAAFILVYDEGGGAYDHTPPPSACLPDDQAPIIPGEASTPGKFDRYGFRVPFVVASAWSKPNHVSHTVYSHTSVLRFLELLFKLPACSDRDANAEPLLDFFDFSKPNFSTPHVPAKVVVADPKTKGC